MQSDEKPKLRPADRQKRPRRLRLSRIQMLEIARYIQAHPAEKLEHVQERFQVSYTQIHTARKKFLSGELDDPPPLSNDATNILKSGITLNELVQKQLDLAAAQIEAAGEKIDVDRRVRLIEMLIDAQKSQQSIQLQTHLKRTDSDIIAFIYRRRVNSGLTDSEIVQLYREDYAMFEATRKSEKKRRGKK